MGIISRRALPEPVPAAVPTAGFAVNLAVSIIGILVLVTCLLIIMIYTDSLLFIVSSTILNHGWGFATSQLHCQAAILLCLVFYMSTKLIYYFMVEKAYIIRSVRLPRMKSKLYLFNCFGMLGPYLAVIVLNFIFRIARIDSDGKCVIGMERSVLIPLISFDVAANVWLTVLFLMPLMKLYSYKNNRKSLTRTVALRTFIGAVLTLCSVVANLATTIILNGEEGWVCIMLCNLEILFSVCVLHWITTKDSQTSDPSSEAQTGNKGQAGLSVISQSTRGARLDDDLMYDAKTTTHIVGNYKSGDSSNDDDLELKKVTSPGGHNIIVTTATEIRVSNVDGDGVSVTTTGEVDDDVHRKGRGSNSMEELVLGAEADVATRSPTMTTGKGARS